MCQSTIQATEFVWLDYDHITYTMDCVGLFYCIFMAKNKRYQVRLDTGDVFAIRNRNISPELVELPKESIEVATKKIRKAGMTDQAHEDALMELLENLFRSSPSMDHIKFEEFAAGFL